MRVMLINGSPHINGNTATALHEMEKIFRQEGIEIDWLQIGGQDIRGCIACKKCRQTGKCIFPDVVNEAAERLTHCDGLVVGSPVYYASANATLIAFLTRLFYCHSCDHTMRVGAAVACARRGGITATYDELNKFFAISGMPIATGQYWNGIHGMDSGEAEQDAEGLQQMRTLAHNTVFLMKSIALGKKEYGLPPKESRVYTNFVR